MEIIDAIPFDLDVEVLLSRLHIAKGSQDEKDVQKLVDRVAPFIRPKAVYKVAYIDGRGSDTVVIAGVTFRSRILQVNLQSVEKVFPYIATCGRELDEIDLPNDDFLMPFYLDTIKGMALDTSLDYLCTFLKHKYRLGQTSSMNPGSATEEVWPIEQQRELFSLFGDVENLIGVRLTDSYLMIPNKSVSGIYFANEKSFSSCQVCPREGCRGRKAPYDATLLQEYQTEVAV